MSLNTLYLFSNVRITPDYSVVHDMDPDTWHDFLMGWLDPMPAGADQQIVYSNNLKLNYYRMPDTLRIEGNYDKLKNATYGFLQDGMYNDQQPAKTSFKYIFFWVKDVRLITQRTTDHTEGGQTVFDDVVELELEMDTWSTYGVGAFQLYDTFVERRHMPRWVNNGTDLSPDWQPIYYPNAGQGIEGAYTKENVQDASGTKTFTHIGTVNISWMFISFLDTNGVAHLCMGIAARDTGGNYKNVYYVHNGVFKKIMYYPEVLDGSAFTAINVNAELVQAICIVPNLYGQASNIVERDDNGTWKLVFDSPIGTVGTNDIAYIDFTSYIYNVGTPYSVSMTVIKPDHAHLIPNPDYDPSDPDSPQYLDDYDEEHEPMMYYSPARVRKCTTSLGGEIFTVPDIAAFEGKVTIKNMFDLNNVALFVYMGTEIDTANILGALGVVETPTLPIYNSAWKSYEAINKVGDEIAYNAKQMQSLANGAAGTASSAIVGTAINPVAGVAGLITGMVGTAATMYGNAEELRAKQVTIKNSPCVVKSGGSGLGATMSWLTDVEYVTLKMDDRSMEKLRFMYYWYGYHVNRMFKGTVDLHIRSKFDYIKTNGAKIKGSLSAGAARQIAAIFDNGVTIYHGADGYILIGTGDMKENDEI